MDLIQIIETHGLPQLFITVTANDTWPEIVDILKKYPNKASIFHPVDVSEFFFKRLQLIMQLFKNGLLGELENFWYRIELQNRGSLHAHIILWLKDKNYKKDFITARLPIDPVLKEKVLKYQNHQHRSRCFNKAKSCIHMYI